ncbi:MAG: IclR family transcriptional regulator [Actinomycetota bacterium]
MSQSARRTMQLVEHLAEAGPSSLSSIASSLELNKTTAFRFVSALVEMGWAQQDPTTRVYGLGPRVLELGSMVLDRMEIRQEVRPHLERLAQLTSETAHLGVLDGLEMVYIDKVEGRQAVSMASRLGARGACHSTALGKVLLAARPGEEWARYVEDVGLIRRTHHTFVHAKRFREELERVRQRGYAIDNVENEDGIRCVAAPIRDHTGEVVAAMSVSGWTVSVTPERIPELIPLVTGQAASASAALGCPTGDGAASGTRIGISRR